MNQLHAFLHAGNVQARPVLGTLFDYGFDSGLTGFFTPTDEKLAFELTGYMDEIDFVAVVDQDQFSSGNAPTVKTQLFFGGNTYTIRTLKTDQSSYTLGLKMIEAPSVAGPQFQGFTIALPYPATIDTIDAVFPQVFSATPGTIVVSLVSPTGGAIFEISVRDGTQSPAGFTIDFGADLPGPGYSISIVAKL